MANVFRSVLLRLQNKSVPATTSDNPVTADTGYDGLGTVTITPQQHSETYTPSANTAANDMGAVHNKRYVNTSGMIVPSGNIPLTQNDTGIDVSSYATASVSVSGTSITPSNSSPASMSSGTLYTPSASGYAISSYSSVTPSNSSPATLSSGSIYKMGGAGKAVASVTDITPSNSTPASMSSGTIYKAGSAGYAIASSPTAVTPSSSGASFSAGIINMSSAGYAYSEQPSGGTAYMEETTLWTNSSPMSNITGAVTLSNSMDNYDYLKYTFTYGAGNLTEYSFVLSVAEASYGQETRCFGVTFSTGNNTGTYMKTVQPRSLTVVYFSKSYKLDFTNNTISNSSAMFVPYKIKGLKLKVQS